MTNYLLDSNIVSYFADKKSPHHEAVTEKIASLQNEDVLSASILLLYENEYGIANAPPAVAKKLRATRQKIIDHLNILQLSVQGAKIFGSIKKTYKDAKGLQGKALERKNIDLIIASTAIAEKVVLVSNDNIFEEIEELWPDFLWENWAKG
jgi:predicted nucleic acid-binding protein